MRRRTIALVGWVVLGLAPAGRGADVADALREARGKVLKVQRMSVVYREKTEINAFLKKLDGRKVMLDRRIRDLRIQLDSFPRRRNNLQEAVHQEWLNLRAERSDIEGHIGDARVRLREIDEVPLQWAEIDGERPMRTGRFDILVAYPNAQREQHESLRTLKSAAEEEAAASNRRVDEILRAANAELNASGHGDAKFGPFSDFLAAYRDYSKATSSPSKSGKKPRTRR